MIRIFTRQMERLRDEQGQALVFVAMLGLVVFLFFAMSMNLGELINTKIKNQNVADATAISGAVWQARAMNLIAGANRTMIELWGVVIAAYGTCPAALAICYEYFCGPVWVHPLFCIACLVGSGVVCAAGLDALGAAVTVGQFQNMVLEGIDRNVIDPDLPTVVNLNYHFKANTASDSFGVYPYMVSTDDKILRRYIPGQVETGEYVFERAGLCETLIAIAWYANQLWHESGGAYGVSDDDWNSWLPTIEGWYAPGGDCYDQSGLAGTLGETVMDAFPLMLRTRRADQSIQNPEALLPISLATYKQQEPPPILGKAAADCTWQQNDTRFPCTGARHYAFASAHAYSPSVSAFYNEKVAGINTAFPVPCIPIVMDWEPRLFPFEPYPNGEESTYGGWVAYQDIAGQVLDEGETGDHDFLLNNVFMLNNRHFFLY